MTLINPDDLAAWAEQTAAPTLPPLVLRLTDDGIDVINPEVIDGRGVVVLPRGTRRTLAVGIAAAFSREDEPLGDLAQCGRTYVHRRHEHTGGWCAGLDGTEAPVPPGLIDRVKARLRGDTTDRTVC